MARPRIRVQHFLACGGAAVEGPAGPGNPYTLRGVGYKFRVAATVEFPAILSDVWVFCRFFNLSGIVGRSEFAVDVVWLEGRVGEELTCYYPGLAVAFGKDQSVVSRAWPLPFLRAPGAGRYELRLRAAPRDRLVAREFIHIEREP